MLTKYLIATVDVQSGESESSLWRRLQGSITRNCADTPLYRFTIPRLRSGTLDSLVKLSDTLGTSSILIEGVVDKIRQQIQDLERDAGAESGAPTVDGVPVETYLSRFVWDEEKYPIKPHPKEIAASIVSRVRKIEDSLKVQAADYSSVNNQIKSIIKKQNISLLQTRDFSSLVKPEDIITSEHLATILVIVPKYSQKEWLSCYEFLDTFVVPRSSKWIYEDNEHALYTVTLFAKVIDNFKVRVREKGFVAPNFTYNPEAQESKKYELEKLLQDKNALRTSLLQFLYASYSEVFSSWMHFTAVFLFVESTLRYGLLIPFLCVVLAPSTKSEKKVSSILGDLCGYANRKYWEESEDGAIHPYVFATIKVS